MPSPSPAASPAAAARLILALLALPAVARATPPANPPGFVLPVAPSSAEASPADALPRRAAAAQAHASWRDREGGADYQPTLSFPRETPVLMLVTTPREPADRALHRRRAIIQACGFLLGAEAFPLAVICVVEADPARPGAPTVRNHPVARADFAGRLRAEAGTPDLAAALRAARANDALTLRLCAALRID